MKVILTRPDGPCDFSYAYDGERGGALEPGPGPERIAVPPKVIITRVPFARSRQPSFYFDSKVGTKICGASGYC
jgi:hypothetical protein